MHDVGPGGQPEPVVEGGPEAGLAVVEPARLVDGDQDVVVEVARVGVGGGPVGRQVRRVEDAPGTGPGEALARHGREGSDHGRRAHARGVAQLLGEPAPRRHDVIVRHRPSPYI